MRIVHILADGTQVDKIEGHVVGKELESFYEVLDKINTKIKEAKHE